MFLKSKDYWMGYKQGYLDALDDSKDGDWDEETNATRWIMNEDRD